MIVIRKSTLEDSEEIVNLFQDAKRVMKERGINQWQGDYPNKIEVEEDIDNGVGYVVVLDNKVVGYVAYVTKKDPNYASIDGAWLNDERYMTLHRTCVLRAYHRQGIMQKIFSYGKDMAKEMDIHNLRIDTHSDNVPMIHAINKFSFKYCGIVQMEDGTDRNAYQLVID